MARKMYAGNAPATTLNGGINSTQTNIVVTSGTGYPSGASGNFWIVIDRGLASEEKILCNNTTGNTITAVDRTVAGNRDGTTNASHLTAAVVEHVFTAQDADEANAHVNDITTDVHGQYLLESGFNTTHDLAARHTATVLGVTPAAGSTTSQTAAAAGASQVFSRDDHVHLQALATPRGVVAYAAQSASYVLTGSSADVTGLSVTFTTLANRRYRLTAEVNSHINAVGDFSNHAKLMEGATIFGVDSNNNGAFVSLTERLHISTILSPSAASHTYKLQGYTSSVSSNGEFVVDASRGAGFILLEDIGAA